MKDKALVYIHGKGGTASASEQFKSLFPNYDPKGAFCLSYRRYGALDTGYDEACRCIRRGFES